MRQLVLLLAVSLVVLTGPVSKAATAGSSYTAMPLADEGMAAHRVCASAVATTENESLPQT